MHEDQLWVEYSQPPKRRARVHSTACVAQSKPAEGLAYADLHPALQDALAFGYGVICECVDVVPASCLGLRSGTILDRTKIMYMNLTERCDGCFRERQLKYKFPQRRGEAVHLCLQCMNRCFGEGHGVPAPIFPGGLPTLGKKR